MTVTELKQKNRKEVEEFIRERLSFGKHINDSIRHTDVDEYYREHKRFEMSGYDHGETGQCTLWNTSIVNEFADLGIYDYTSYLFLDFHKGTPTLYMKYFHEQENAINHRMDGYGTVEIIYTIFQYTIFSNKQTRRRD